MCTVWVMTLQASTMCMQAHHAIHSGNQKLKSELLQLTLPVIGSEQDRGSFLQNLQKFSICSIMKGRKTNGIKHFFHVEHEK